MLTVTLPVLETERLTLRPPRMSDAEAFTAFISSDRSIHVGGPFPEPKAAMRIFGNLAGLWLLRGYSLFVATLKGSNAPIGAFGPWYPKIWPEPEFGWSLWSAEHEGKGYVTEAMRTLVPWTWETVGLDTAISVIDEGNAASIRVAERLGATVDEDATRLAGKVGSPFYEAGGEGVRIYRHRKEAWA